MLVGMPIRSLTLALDSVLPAASNGFIINCKNQRCSSWRTFDSAFEEFSVAGQLARRKEEIGLSLPFLYLTIYLWATIGSRSRRRRQRCWLEGHSLSTEYILQWCHCMAAGETSVSFGIIIMQVLYFYGKDVRGIPTGRGVGSRIQTVWALSSR